MTTDDEPEEKTEVVARDIPAEPRASGQPFRLGRYRLEKMIGEGGMAEVYLAKGEGTGALARSVVVKRIRPSLLQNAASKKHVEMFLHEARLLASLDHVNIVQILELGIEPPRNGKAIGEHFIAMEHLEGLTLRDLAWRHWSAGQPIPMELIVKAVGDLCNGLDHAHQMKDPATGKSAALVHRDISPDNVFLTTSGVTKLLDFGVAKREGWQGLTTAGELKGKIPFMAPEQLREEPVDGRTDVFAVGVLLYWLLAGRRPFDGPSEIFVMKAILDDEPIRLRVLNPAVPVALDDLVLSCIAKDRKKRFSSGALRDALLALVPAGAAPVAACVAAALKLPAVDRERAPAVASAPTVPWRAPANPSRTLPPEFTELPATASGDDDPTLPGIARPVLPPGPPGPPSPPKAPTKPHRIATSGRALVVSVDAPEVSDVARLEAEIVRLQEKLAAATSSSPSADLVGAVGPLLWGLEQAIAHFAALAPGDAVSANHKRQLQILHAVLKKLVDATPQR